LYTTCNLILLLQNICMYVHIHTYSCTYRGTLILLFVLNSLPASKVWFGHHSSTMKSFSFSSIDFSPLALESRVQKSKMFTLLRSTLVLLLLALTAPTTTAQWYVCIVVVPLEATKLTKTNLFFFFFPPFSFFCRQVQEDQRHLHDTHRHCR
jgi:hypothetical protein